VVEDEIDEVFGDGGSYSTLNSISQFGMDNPESAFTFYQGALDLYRYSAPETPSFSSRLLRERCRGPGLAASRGARSS
jgi:hypothetical protein